MKLKIWPALVLVVVVVTTDVLGVQPRRPLAKSITPALQKWRQQQILRRRKLQNTKNPTFKLVPVNSKIKLQKKLTNNKNELKHISIVSRPQKLRFAAPRVPRNKKVLVAHINKPIVGHKGRIIKAKIVTPVYRSSKVRLGKPQLRNQLGKARPEAPSIGKFTENLYPSNAYQQVEHYVDSVIRGQQSSQTKNEFSNSNNRGASNKASTSRTDETTTPSYPAQAPLSAYVPVGSPPAPVAAPPSAPVVAPAPAQKASSASVVAAAPAVPPSSSPIPAAEAAPVASPATNQAPLPAPAPAYVAPAPVTAKAMAKPASVVSAPVKKSPDGQVVEMPGPNGKAMKYYVQSFTSEIAPDGKGGYLQSPISAEGHAVHGPVKAVPLGPASSSKSKVDKSEHKAKKYDCTVSNINQTNEEKQASKRVYSLSGHVFADLGCFSDCWKRAIPTLEGNHDLLMEDDYKNRQDALQKCAEAALDRGFKYFALQNGGQCFAGKTANRRFNIYGHSDRCRDDGLGGTYANEVYMFEESPTPKKIPSDYSPTEPSKDQTGRCRHENCDDGDTDSYDTSLLKEEKALSDEEEDELEAGNSKHHRNNLKAIGAAIKDILKKQDGDKAKETTVSNFAEETGETDKTKTENSESKVKDSAVNILANALIKETKTKHKSSEKNSTAAAVKPAKNDSSDVDNLSNDETKNNDGGKKKKNLPLGASVARGEKPPCICPDKVCSSKLDLAFAIDASAGAEPGGKEKMGEIMEFARRVASAFKVTPADSHLGLITFSTDAQVMLNFKRFSEPDSFVEAKDAVRVKPHTGKFTGQALRLAKDGLFGAVHRPDALDVLVLMTDGPSTDNVMAPARSLRDMGVKIIGIGIGDHINKRQMANIASDPDDANMFLTEFDTLEPLIPKVQKSACIGGVLKEPTTPCRCDEHNTQTDTETDAETAAFLSLLSPSIETISPLKPERHTDIPTASPVDKYRLSSYLLKREGISSFIDRSRKISSRALPFNNPHPEDFDASPNLHFNYENNPQKTREYSGSSKYQHSYENENFSNSKEERNGGGKGGNTISPNIASMQTDEPEYTNSDDQGRAESSYNKIDKNKNPSNALYTDNDQRTSNNINYKETNEYFNQQNERQTSTSDNKENSQRYEGNSQSNKEGQRKVNNEQQADNNREGKADKETSSSKAESMNENSNKGYKTEKDFKNEGQNKDNQEPNQKQTQQQMNKPETNSPTGSTNSQESRPYKEESNSHAMAEQNHNSERYGENLKESPQGNSKDVEKDRNLNEPKTDGEERKPDLSKEDLNTQGSQGKGFSSNNEQSKNLNQQKPDYGTSGTETSSRFGTGSPEKDSSQSEKQNNNDNEVKNTDNKQGMQSDKLKGKGENEDQPFKNDFSKGSPSSGTASDDASQKKLESNSAGNNPENKQTGKSNGDIQNRNVNEETDNDPKAKAEMYNQEVYEQETSSDSNQNRASMTKLEKEPNGKERNTYEGTLYKEKNEKSTDSSGNVVEKQKYKGTLFLYGSDDKNQDKKNEKTAKEDNQSYLKPANSGAKEIEKEGTQQEGQKSLQYGQQGESSEKQNENLPSLSGGGKQPLKQDENSVANVKNDKDDGKQNDNGRKSQEYEQKDQNADKQNGNSQSLQENGQQPLKQEDNRLSNANNDKDDGKQNDNGRSTQGYEQQGKNADKQNENSQSPQENGKQQLKQNDNSAENIKNDKDDGKQNDNGRYNGNNDANAQMTNDDTANGQGAKTQGSTNDNQNTGLKQEGNYKTNEAEPEGSRQSNYQPNDNGNDKSKKPTQNNKITATNQQENSGSKENGQTNDKEKGYASQDSGKDNKGTPQNENRPNGNAKYNYQDTEGQRKPNQNQFNAGSDSQEETSFHGHGHGPHGHDDHHEEKHEHEHEHEHGHEDEHGPKKPKFSEDSDQRIEPSTKLKEMRAESTESRKADNYDRNSLKEGFHFDSSEMQGTHAKYESQQENEETARVQRTDKDNNKNRKIISESNERDKNQDRERQNTQELEKNEEQKTQNRKEDKQESFKNKPDNENQQNGKKLAEKENKNENANNYESGNQQNDEQKYKSEREDTQKVNSKEEENRGNNKEEDNRGKFNNKEDENRGKDYNKDDNRGRFDNKEEGKKETFVNKDGSQGRGNNEKDDNRGRFNNNEDQNKENRGDENQGRFNNREDKKKETFDNKDGTQGRANNNREDDNKGRFNKNEEQNKGNEGDAVKGRFENDNNAKNDQNREERKPEDNNSKNEKNEQSQVYSGKQEERPGKQQQEKGKSETEKSDKMNEDRKTGQEIMGNQNTKADQQNLKEIKTALEESKQSPKKQPSDQASLADMQDNNYETINDIIKYPKKNFRNSNFVSVTDETNHLLEKPTQTFTKGYSGFENHHIDQEMNRQSIGSHGSSDRQESLHTPERYNEEANKPISEFHGENYHAESEGGHFSELRKQYDLDGESRSMNVKDTRKPLKLGPKGPSVWHKPPKIQNSNHQEGVSRNEEYPQKNPDKKPLNKEENKRPQIAPANRISPNNKPQRQQGFQQIQVLKAPGGGSDDKGKQQQQPMDPDSVMLMNEAEKAGQEMENEMNSNNMDGDMSDMDTQSGGMRHHISRKAEPPNDIVPTVAVRDFTNSDQHIENSAKHELTARGKIQRHSSKRAPIQLDGVQKAKTAEKNKGILLKDPFLESSHFWPMDKSKAILAIDIQTGHNAILMTGSRIEAETETKIPYASTEHPGSYVILGDFNGTCFSNPGKCILGGLSLSFWADLDREKVHDNQDAYIISGGGQSKESRGFAFLFFHGTYVFVLSTADKQWKMMIPESNVPTGRWANFAFIWNKHGNLTYYLDGVKQMTVKGNATKRPTDKYPLITVGKPNNADKKEYMYPLKIHSIAMWDRPLKNEQVKGIYDGIKSMQKGGKLSERYRIARPST